MPGEPVLGRRNIATAIAGGRAPHGRRGADHRSRGPRTSTRRCSASSMPRRRCSTRGEGFDWATAEALAFGSLIAEDHCVRLSGQDSGRGTFSQRHAVLGRPADRREIHPAVPRSTAAGSRCATARLSEFGVLGFEYGYSLADPRTLVLWEAQFGDFANGAQTIIDQFIAGGRGQVAARERAGDAASARLRRAGAGAQLGAARALSAALRRGQSPGRQLHHAGELFPHPAAAAAARFPQAADHDDAEVAAAAQAGGFEARRLHRREPFPPDRQRPQPAGGRRDDAAGAVLGQARL